MDEFEFTPVIRDWFRERFGDPTEPQRLGWPHIARRHHTLIAAPTGSGKTLAAFLVSLDRLLQDWIGGRLQDEVRTVYVSPLKALSNDIHRNLEQPLAEISQRAQAAGYGPPPIRTMVRTGDTPPSERQRMLRHPPHILVTTPESLYLLVTSEKSRQLLRSVETIIVDEIHALARDKRGSHMALSLERLEALCERPPLRVGLSATQRPIDEIASFLVGSTPVREHGKAACQIVDVGHVRELDLGIDVPPSELEAVCSHEQWSEVYQRLTELILAHRSTLIFVNTRRLAERVAHHLTELLGAEAVASHHGSLSRDLRLGAERRLKSGQLKAIVATASLEMGIDIGFIDLVCQIGSPRSIATFLQRVGRSGHSLGVVPKGRLFPLTRDELIECMALVRAVRRGDLDRIEIPVAPLDILAQQIVAAVACEEWDQRELLELCRRAWPFRDLAQGDYDATVTMLSEGIGPTRRGAYLHRDAIHGRLRARRGARLAALTSGGAIPERGEYRVVTEPDKTFVGSVDEDFAIESVPGDIFLLGTTSWRIRQVRGGEVVVRDAEGAPPNIPFWFGEAPGRTTELSSEVSQLRDEIGHGEGENEMETMKWLEQDCGASHWATQQVVQYIRAGKSALGLVPTAEHIVFERFFDESGGMQLVLHSPLGARINRAWGLALRKRFCRSFDFELQASADDDGIVLSLGPQHSFPVESLFKMIGPQNAKDLLEQSLLAVPLFQVRWRWNLTRSLAVLRQRGGKRVPPYLQRFQSDDLLASVFPDQVGCLENHHGDVLIPDHPLVRQTMHDCLTEATDLAGWLVLLEKVKNGEVEFIARDTREPSPFSHELLNANPYSFLDPAPLEERRTRAVTARRTLSGSVLDDLGRLDPAAIKQVCEEAWPLVRDREELHDALLSLVAVGVNKLEVVEGAHAWWEELVQQGRVAHVISPSAPKLCVAAERVPVVSAVYNAAEFQPPISLSAALDQSWKRTEALVELIRGQIQHSGPTTAEQLAKDLGLKTSVVSAALEALEGEGIVLRGQFTQRAKESALSLDVQWCERRLLARIHRLTLDGLRRQVQPVEPEVYITYLLQHHHVLSDQSWGGPVGVREAIEQLQGFEMPAGVWEQSVLASRVADYDSGWLDQLFMSGELIWGRLSPPKRDAEDGPSMALLTRTVPISLMLREHLPLLLTADRGNADGAARSNAKAVLLELTARGALFFQELSTVAELLPAHLEEALRELAALGLVSSDGFAPVRAFVRPRGGGRAARRLNRSGTSSRALPAGRWSVFPGDAATASHEQHLERWCWQLLRRYGVVFRDLLARETAAPPWRELVSVYRRLERRGELRGGRFILGVGGEQFGTDAAVGQLRKLREQGPEERWVVISAADPLNLVGIVSDGGRVPATHKNSLVLMDGRCVAAKQAGRIVFRDDIEPLTAAEMTRALQLHRRVTSAEASVTV